MQTNMVSIFSECFYDFWVDFYSGYILHYKIVMSPLTIDVAFQVPWHPYLKPL